MNIEDLTIRQARELAHMFAPVVATPSPDSTFPWETGKIYQIRTVTMIYTGRLTNVTSQELVLVDAAWIADAGRWMQACEKQTYDEVEPYPTGKPVIIGRGGILDAIEVSSLNRSQK